MRVMLINPPPIRYTESYDKPEYGHIGLAYLAASLEQHGFQQNKELYLVDAKLACWNFQKVLDHIKEVKPEVIGLSAKTFDIMWAGRLAGKIKEIDPTIVTIIGGVHSSALPVETLEKIPDFDIAMVGECERTFIQLIEGLASGKKTFPKIPGVVWREDQTIRYEQVLFLGETLNTPEISRIENLDELPLPAWHMLPRAKEYQIMTARGCPRSCVFCMSPYGRKFIREMSPERVIEEMEWVIQTFQPVRYRFNDETFAFNAERIHKVLDIMIQKGFGKKTKLFASMRADKMKPDILEKMKAANFFGIEVGVETGDATIMKKIKKGETMEETEQGVNWVKKCGIKVYCSFIIGHPGETYKTAMATIRFAAKLHPDSVSFGLMVPYPGTEVAEYAQKGMHGYKLLSADWTETNRQYGNALELEGLSRRTMKFLQAWGYIKVFLSNRQYWELLKFFWTYRKASRMFISKQLQQIFTREKKRRKPVTIKDAGASFRYLNYRS